MTTRLAGAAIAALALLPATAQAAALAPLKPCYISVTQKSPGAPPQITRESLDLGGSGFTAGALVDVSFDGKLDRTLQADAAGNLPPQVLQSPYRAKGQGTFTLTAAERGNPANTVSAPSRTTALTLSLKPKKAKPSKRIRFKGSGFTAQKAVWAHYLYNGKVRKTVRLVKRINNPCGTFSVKRKQIPVKHPKLGVWRLQVDQQKRYSRAPDGVNVRADIKVQKVFRASTR
jgi:hypothetical protein